MTTTFPTTMLTIEAAPAAAIVPCRGRLAADVPNGNRGALAGRRAG
jgi:hypothetical protein